jgi:hypothetical protein
MQVEERIAGTAEHIGELARVAAYADMGACMEAKGRGVWASLQAPVELPE